VGRAVDRRRVVDQDVDPTQPRDLAQRALAVRLVAEVGRHEVHASLVDTALDQRGPRLRELIGGPGQQDQIGSGVRQPERHDAADARGLRP
jgi:hypothetical protein